MPINSVDGIMFIVKNSVESEILPYLMDTS